MIETQFTLQKKLDIIFGDGSKRGPFFQGNKISIPYLYVFHLRQYFNKRRHIHWQKDLDILIDAALIHALYHELGHALINHYRLPVAGLEEDTVDNLSNLLLIAHTPNGEELTRQAAMVFYLKSKRNQSVVKERYFWDEHRLSKQRYYSMLCQLYGSDPKKHSALIKEKGFSDERAQKCVLEYRRMAQAWGQMLRPYWNPNS